MDFKGLFTDRDCSAMDSYYYVFKYFYEKLTRQFLDETAASIAADLAIAFLDNFALDCISED